MQKAHDSSYNDYWKNKPNITTPIVQDQLNRIETTIDTIDDRVVTFDTTKANQIDYLTTIVGVNLDDQTGVLTFTRANGTTIVFDTDLEKIATNFDYDDDPTSPHYQDLIITLDDGTVKYVNMSALITEYEFTDSSVIHFTITNGVISADVINGSITAEKLQPNFLADCVSAKEGAETAETNAETAETNAQTHQYTAEAWAKGTKNGVPVTPTDEQYHDNAYYWAQQARSIVGDKVDSFNGRTGTVVAQDGDYESGMIVPEAGAISGQVPVVRNVGTGQDVKLRYVNEDWDIGLKPHIIVISETGSAVTLTKGTKVIYASETSTGHFEADVTEFGTWVIDSVLSGDDAQKSLVVDAVKIYTVDDSHFHADIEITFPLAVGATCSLSATGQDTKYATTSPYTFTVHEAGSYTLTVTYDGNDYTETISVTTSGQTFTNILPTTSSAPTDDIEMWLFFGGIDNSESTYTSLADILADSSALSTLMASTDAVDYLVRSTTWASTVCANSDAMSYIGLNNYCANTLLADSTWESAIVNSTYFDSVLNAKVPTMTSDTTPSGTVIYSSNYPSASAWAYNAFGTGYGWTPTRDSTNNWIGYVFTSAKKIIKATLRFGLGGTSQPNCKIQASNDGSTWVDLKTGITLPQGNAEYDLRNNTNSYTRYRLFVPNKMYYVSGQSTYTAVLNQLQFYGREDV